MQTQLFAKITSWEIDSEDIIKSIQMYKITRNKNKIWKTANWGYTLNRAYQSE